MPNDWPCDGEAEKIVFGRVHAVSRARYGVSCSWVQPFFNTQSIASSKVAPRQPP